MAGMDKGEGRRKEKEDWEDQMVAAFNLLCFLALMKGAVPLCMGKAEGQDGRNSQVIVLILTP